MYHLHLRVQVATVTFLSLLMTDQTTGADRPIVDVSPDGLVPARIEVHVGETITWRPIGGVRIRLEFDPHRDAHEVIETSKEVRAVFTKAGEHWYIASIAADGHQHARGVVVVQESDKGSSLPPTCGPQSSHRICFEP